MAFGWDKEKIKTDNGEIKEGIAPFVISASRSTDIPAYYAKWFINRLEKGYATWINPFNRTKPQYISFKKTRVITFWTKNAKPLIKYLDEIDKKGINYYFQYTLNDYDNENFEPNVPKLENRIKTFIELSKKIGKEKVIWRFDPLLLTPELSVRDLSKKIWYLGNKIIKYTNKLVFSFIDVSDYKKVQNNLIKETKYFDKSNILSAEFTNEQKNEFAGYMQKIHNEWKKINPDFKIATCAEDIDLYKYNIEHNKCIDDDLMIELFSEDSVLMKFLGYQPENTIFETKPKERKLKDKGQRLACGCIFSKDIGSYNTCNHLCVYCYANTSRKVVTNNLNIINNNSESILPT